MEHNIILDNLESKFAALNISNIFIKKATVPPLGLVTPASISAFFDCCTAVAESWTTLLKHTSLPETISNSNPRIPAAFITMDHTINGGLCLLSRFVWVKLFRLIKSIEGIVKNERRLDLVKRTPGYGNANIVANIYMRFHYCSKRVAHEHKRKAKRWTQLAGPSLLLLLAFFTAANSIV
ncbi:uncharacterized protein PgNI_11666 [Pyricularia grisea]|uniref:Uncharacterized protein n=1 Tax=Pyricularia grisea TaxID=148305 RepID=A0A6P8ANF1_PYRGI|nr:uncharacterized protein PgNI_11666 [Pyricularia grisea]TLD03550.1 hypothetical protein PgNI_11666 [Pyricularia grisea]